MRAQLSFSHILTPCLLSEDVCGALILLAVLTFMSSQNQSPEAEGFDNQSHQSKFHTALSLMSSR